MQFLTTTSEGYISLFFTLALMLVLLYFAWYSIVLLGKMDMMGRDTNILHIPYVAIYSVVPVGCLLMMWNYTQSIRKRLRAYKEGGLD